MKNKRYIVVVFCLIVTFCCKKSASPSGSGNSTNSATTGGTVYNTLHIPRALSGTNFNLTLAKSAKQFFSEATTATYAYNGGQFWGPTLVFNKGDNITLHITNGLDDTTNFL